MCSGGDTHGIDQMEDTMDEKDFRDESIVGDSIDESENCQNVDSKEPCALKWPQIVFVVKIFYCLYHVALEKLLYDALIIIGLYQRFWRNPTKT